MVFDLKYLKVDFVQFLLLFLEQQFDLDYLFFIFQDIYNL